MRIAVDTKNLALYTGGIAAFFRPLLAAWIAARPRWDFVLVGPPFPCEDLLALPNCGLQPARWPAMLPRWLRHPWYDNVSFPAALAAARVQGVFTPYHDVRLPRGTRSALMVHDTCLHDLPGVYPRRIRGYYLHMLRRNLRRAGRVLTVSRTAHADLQARYGIDAARSGIVPNAIDPRLVDSPAAPALAARLREQRAPGLHVFYPGGSEYRKNIGHLVAAAALSPSMQVWATGERDAAWARALAEAAHPVAQRFHFLGRLGLDDLAAQYRACDAVVYPTRCEGFGRVALEAMAFGAPLACSDIPVLHEVAVDYPVYFDPRQPASIAAALAEATQAGPRTPRRPPMFEPERVAQAFIAEMDRAFAD